jgi:acyl transferase domain-containing protein/acyl carrier protein
MKRIAFLYSGEGTKHDQSSFKLIKTAPVWDKIEGILQDQYKIDLEDLWHREIGEHGCPSSALLTVIGEICLAELWKQWGYTPDAVLGHSIGEVAAAFEAGFYTLPEVLNLSFQIGKVAAKLDGAMMHGSLSDSEIAALPVTISSLNFHDGDMKHVTVSGSTEEMRRLKERHPVFTDMRPPHPWHHPDYERFAAGAEFIPAHGATGAAFVSGVTGEITGKLSDDYWRRWFSSSIDFISAIETLKDKFSGDEVEIIEIGFHPVLEKCCEVFDSYTYVSSMFRGEDEIKWILFQRNKLEQDRFLELLGKKIDTYRQNLDFAGSLAYQDFTSRTFVEFAAVLEPLFPGLAPQDFYRYKSVQQLIDGFGAEAKSETSAAVLPQRNKVAIAGMSCKFPASAENPARFWQLLAGGEDQVRADSSRGNFEAGFLDQEISKFDHRYFGIPDAEAKTMDPQQILALELTELLWRDAGIDPATLDKKRIGVYLGVWNEEYLGDRRSVYYPTGSNPSIIASRVSYHYDLRGPSWVSNTACSSSLVALHYACKDIEAGRVDYAIAGGVNIILGNTFTENMRSAGFLSKDSRCKAFDNSANGYVRSEGGGMVLLANRMLVDKHYGTVEGTSINQNGGRAQVITAPHPEAQEEVILDACRDAGIEPREIAYVECHGTGTKIGDPIEISGLQNTVAKDRSDTCYLGSVKSNIGHLESAAGIAGLIKSILILNNGAIPGDLHFSHPNEYIDFDSFNLKVVTEETPIDPQSYIGVSSYGFGGANAHIILAGVDEASRKPVVDLPIPFQKDRAAPLTGYYQLDESHDEESPIEENGRTDSVPESLEEIEILLKRMFFEVTAVESIEKDVELSDQGLDSMSATEFVTQLETELNVTLDPDILFDYPLLDQLSEHLFSKLTATG